MGNPLPVKRTGAQERPFCLGTGSEESVIRFDLKLSGSNECSVKVRSMPDTPLARSVSLTQHRRAGPAVAQEMGGGHSCRTRR
jgi:hypothetical protein